MPENQNIFSSLLDKSVEFGKTNIELYKLIAIEKLSEVVSTVIPDLLGLLFSLTFLMFISIGGAFYLGYLLGEIYLGFIAVAIFYLIIGIAAGIVFHTRIKKMIQNYIINQLFRNK